MTLCENGILSRQNKNQRYLPPTIYNLIFAKKILSALKNIYQQDWPYNN